MNCLYYKVYLGVLLLAIITIINSVPTIRHIDYDYVYI